MPALTRRNPETRQQSWLVYYGDVHVGTIGLRSSNPFDTDQWAMALRLLSGGLPARRLHVRHGGDLRRGARRVQGRLARLPVKRTEVDFQEWRDQRDWTARKYRLWDAGERLPSQQPNSIMRCACGESFDSHRLEESLIHVPHLSAAHEIRRTNRFTDRDATARKLMESPTRPSMPGRAHLY